MGYVRRHLKFGREMIRGKYITINSEHTTVIFITGGLQARPKLAEHDSEAIDRKNLVATLQLLGTLYLRRRRRVKTSEQYWDSAPAGRYSKTNTAVDNDGNGRKYGSKNYHEPRGRYRSCGRANCRQKRTVKRESYEADEEKRMRPPTGLKIRSNV